MSPAPTPRSDTRLVREAKSGRREAAEELAVRLRRPAFLFALQLVGDREMAMDVAQDAMLRFHASLHRFHDEKPVLPWLFQIVRNRVRDLKRREQVRRTESLEGLLARPAAEPRATGPGPEARAMQRELQVRIWKGLAGLPRAQREILVLREYQDLSYAEIAEVLGVPIGTVMSRLHAARKKLRGILGEHLREENHD